jgi:hypothetical protein
MHRRARRGRVVAVKRRTRHQIVVDRTAALTGQSIPYQTLLGRAFGELDPNDPLNAEITDLQLAPRNANGKVEYVASFQVVKPVT